MSLHSAQTANHRLESWVYADAAARAAATGFVAGDVGKIAYQTDTGVYYRLTDESPITWVEATSAAASETLAGKVELATTTEAETGTDTARAVTPAGLPMRKIGTGWALGTGGNARGTGAVDLQTVRAAAGQVASGDNAVIGGGTIILPVVTTQQLVEVGVMLSVTAAQLLVEVSQISLMVLGQRLVEAIPIPPVVTTEQLVEAGLMRLLLTIR